MRALLNVYKQIYTLGSESLNVSCIAEMGSGEEENISHCLNFSLQGHVRMGL